MDYSTGLSTSSDGFWEQQQANQRALDLAVQGLRGRESQKPALPSRGPGSLSNASERGSDKYSTIDAMTPAELQQIPAQERADTAIWILSGPLLEPSLQMQQTALKLLKPDALPVLKMLASSKNGGALKTVLNNLHNYADGRRYLGSIPLWNSMPNTDTHFLNQINTLVAQSADPALAKTIIGDPDYSPALREAVAKAQRSKNPGWSASKP